MMMLMECLSVTSAHQATEQLKLCAEISSSGMWQWLREVVEKFSIAIGVIMFCLKGFMFCNFICVLNGKHRMLREDSLRF